jgi:hypothetical protein
MVIVVLIALQIVSVPAAESLEETTAAHSLSLADAYEFHALVQAALPANDYELELSGFPRRKWVKGLEPFKNTKNSLGSWIVLQHKELDGRTIRRQVLRIRLSKSSAKEPKWKAFDVEFDGDDSNTDTIKVKSEITRRIRESVKK